jgi:hypothetical protein
MKDNLSFQKDGADVLSCDYFQVGRVKVMGLVGRG